MESQYPIDVDIAWLEKLNQQLEPLGGKASLENGQIHLVVTSAHAEAARKLVREALLNRLDTERN